MKAASRKAALGGVLVLGIGLAMLLRGLDFDIGTGGKQPEQGGTAEVSPEETTQQDLQATTASGRRTVPFGSEAEPEGTPVREVPLPDTSRQLTVIVEETHYLWGTNDNATLPVKPLPLSEIVEKARQAQGDAQGIRVRIYHVGSALPSAETELVAALKAAGLKETEIFFEQRVIELPQQ